MPTEEEQRLAAMLRESRERPYQTVTAYSEGDRQYLLADAAEHERIAARRRREAAAADPIERGAE